MKTTNYLMILSVFLSLSGCKKDNLLLNNNVEISSNNKSKFAGVDKMKISSSDDDPNEIDDSLCPLCDGGTINPSFFSADGTIASGSLTSENFFKVTFKVKKNETTGFYEAETFNIVKDPNSVGFPFNLTTVWKYTNPTGNGMILTFELKKMLTGQNNTFYTIYDGTITIDFVAKTVTKSW